MTRTSKGWVLIAKKDEYEYKAGEIKDVGTFRRVLLMGKGKNGKVVPCTITYEA